jgi:membrane protein DedA with SNARE-associated domain
LIWVLILTLSGFALGKGYDNVELWLEPVAKTVKYLLMIAAIAFIAWLGLRVWRRR